MTNLCGQWKEYVKLQCQADTLGPKKFIFTTALHNALHFTAQRQLGPSHLMNLLCWSHELVIRVQCAEAHSQKCLRVCAVLNYACRVPY